MDVKHLVYLLPERPFKCVYTHTHTHKHTQWHIQTQVHYTQFTKKIKQVEQSLTAEKDISVHGENMAGLVYCSAPSIHDFLEGRGGFITEITVPSYRIGHFVFIHKARVHYAIITEIVSHSL